MVRPIGDIGENFLKGAADLGRFAGAALDELGDAARPAVDTFVRAASLVEGHASRAGILSHRVFPWREVGASESAGPVTSAARASDRDFDGFYVGADGRAYPPTTPLNQIPRVQPTGGRTSDETLIYINGISTTRERQFGSLQQIADRTGAQVVGVHNATQGGFLDVIQSAGDTIDVGRNPAVDTLADTVYDEIKAGRTVHLMAHSQGALITSRALQDVYNRLRVEDGMSRQGAERLLSNVKVETFGGAAGSYPDGPQYVHYVNRRDGVASLLGLGPVPNPFVRPGRGAVVRRFNEGRNAHGFEETYLPRRVPFEQARRGDFRR